MEAVWQSVGEQRTTGPTTLDELSRESDEALARLYASGRVSDAFFERSGRPRGRMLAVRRLTRPAVFGALRSFAGSEGFPWGGKSFFSEARGRGRGINRVRLGPLRFEWYPFDTKIGPSRLDGKDTVVLDYDKAENPFFIRPIHDEIREIAPGLFLGSAMWKHGGGATHVLWFALDFNTPEPVGA